jgi:hypothetical protein
VARAARRLAAAAACLGLLAAAGCGGDEPSPPAAAAARSGPRLSSFPAASSVGVPRGWKPAETRRNDLVVSKKGAVVEDILFAGGNLIVDAPNVTVRRVRMQGGRIINWPGPTCRNGLVVEDSTFEPPPGQRFSPDAEGATGTGGYTARRVKIWRRPEGFRDGGRSAGCGPVRIEDSFVKIAIPPGCPGDPHSDGIQGVDGPPLTVDNVTIDFREAACGTAPFFVPDEQGNTTVKVDRLLVMGGGATFRLGVPGSVRRLSIVDRSWSYYPVDVKCELLTAWDARLVRITRSYRVSRSLRRQRCR